MLVGCAEMLCWWGHGGVGGDAMLSMSVRCVGMCCSGGGGGGGEGIYFSVVGDAEEETCYGQIRLFVHSWDHRFSRVEDFTRDLGQNIMSV